MVVQIENEMKSIAAVAKRDRKAKRDLMPYNLQGQVTLKSSYNHPHHGHAVDNIVNQMYQKRDNRWGCFHKEDKVGAIGYVSMTLNKPLILNGYAVMAGNWEMRMSPSAFRLYGKSPNPPIDLKKEEQRFRNEHEIKQLEGFELLSEV